jgi:predicted lipoprotein with Yx(FWY)xxD motif
VAPPARRAFALGALALALAASACGSASAGPAASTDHNRGTVVDIADVGRLGPILTTTAGMTLYMFPPDEAHHVTCMGACAGTWPPLTTPTSMGPEAGPGVKQSLLGVDANPDGPGSVVTYAGWPLYTYQGDVAPGQASGQDVDVNGGLWYVLGPRGRPITTPVSPTLP